MGKRFLLAGLCALGVTGFVAGPASASPAPDLYGKTFKTIQVFDANGLDRVIDCTVANPDAVCADPNLLQVQLRGGAPLDGTPTNVIGAYRTLDANGNPVVELANNDASMAVLNASRTAGTAGLSARNVVAAKASMKGKKFKKVKKASKKDKKSSK